MPTSRKSAKKRSFRNAGILPVPTLPATGIAGVPYLLPDGTRWEWRSVVELNSDLIFTPIGYILDDLLLLSITLKDTNQSDAERFFVYASFGGSIRFGIRLNVNRTITLQVGDNFLDSIATLQPNIFVRLSARITNGICSIKIGEAEKSADFTGLVTNKNIDSVFIYDQTENSPLQVCCIKQSINGSLIDNIPCRETTGATLANIQTPARPATLSDSTAHAMAWAPLT